MDVNTIRFYMNKAKKAKSDVTSVYNEVLKYTDSTYQIFDSATKNFVPNEIDSIIPTSLDDLVSFLMSSMISRSSPWATITMNKELYRLVNSDVEDFTSDQELVMLNKSLEDISSVTYTYLNQSNYYSEIARALRECVNIGTGAFRVSERDEPTTPFVFQYLPQDDLFYWEDGFGRPVYIFRYLRNMNVRNIQLMFGEGAKPPSTLKNDDQDTTTLLEVVYPSETKPNHFTYEVYTEDLSTKVFELQELEYCPIVIFRWSKEGSNPNGLGLSIRGLKAFKELEDAKEKRKSSAEKILDPPLFIRGDRALAQMLSLKAGAVNYAGTATPTQMALKQDISVEPIMSVGNLLPLDQDIVNLKSEIRELYTSNPLGAINDYKRRSALESQIRLEALRKKWALSLESLERELLMPTFLTPLKILVKKKKIEFDVGDLDTTMIVYKNALALSQEAENVEMVNVYINQSLLAMQYAEKVGLKLDQVLIYFRENLGLPLQLAKTSEELAQLRDQIIQDQANAEIASSQAQANMLRQQEIEQEAKKLELRAAESQANVYGI